MTTSVYFKVTWIFKDDRNSVTSDFTVEIYDDVLQSIPITDYEEDKHIYEKFHSAWFKAFPHFKIEEYKITALGKRGRVLNIQPNPILCTQLNELIEIHKKTCVRAEGAIPLTVEQRRRTQQPTVTNTLAATKKVCRECRGSITGISFQCVHCKDYIMCCLCVTSGKHPQHGVIRATDSMVDRDTVAKLMSAAVKVVELEAKIKEKDAEIQSLVSARSQAVALLSQPCDRVTSPENKKRKTGVYQGPFSNNIKAEVAEVYNVE